MFCRFCDPLQASSNNEHLGWNYYRQEVLRFLRIFQLLINLSTIWKRQRNLFSISILKLGTGMTIPAFLQFRKNSLNASISISDHFRLCPQPSGDNISAPQVYSAALTVDHNINEFVNFLRLSTYTAGHIRLNLAAEVVPFFTTNSVVWWKVLDQRKFCNFSDQDHPPPHNILQNYLQAPFIIKFELKPFLIMKAATK